MASLERVIWCITAGSIFCEVHLLTVEFVKDAQRSTWDWMEGCPDAHFEMIKYGFVTVNMI